MCKLLLQIVKYVFKKYTNVIKRYKYVLKLDYILLYIHKYVLKYVIMYFKNVQLLIIHIMY
jgi:hypothetical protein